MSVTSTTLAGVNVWRFSGAVTDAEIKTAWAALIVNQRYKPGRIIYIDNTCDLTGVRGTYYVDCEALGIILHSSRDKTKTVFNNWILTQTAGLSVGARNNFVRVTNGTTISTTTTDGIDMKGGGFIYAVQGNPGGADPRYLNEMIFGSLDGAIITSQAYTEQEVEPTSYGKIWKGLTLQKVLAFPILGNAGGTQRQVVYRSSLNTENATQRIVRPYYNNSVCYVSSTVRRAGVAATTNLIDTYGSTGTAVIMLLNNYTDETWFGASKTTLPAANWSAGNRVIGGVLKKIQVQPSTLIRTYDSRSTTASQKSTFSETTQDFLSGTDSTTADASTGKASIVCVGAIATGSSLTVARYAGQKFTLQKFGYRVQVETPDMTFGDDDLSAYAPITMTEQSGIVRTQAEITAATTVNDFQQLLEELHVLALAQVGAASYNAYGSGNLFTFEGGKLKTNFASVVVNATASSKISYNSTTNVLTVKSTTMTSTSDVTEWDNSVGTVTLQNGAKIEGVYTTSSGTSCILTLKNVSATGVAAVWHPTTSATELFQTNATGSATDYTLYYPPGSAGLVKNYARELYGQQRVSGSVTLAAGLNTITVVDVEDVGIAQPTLATVQAYTEITNPDQFYDRTAAFRLTEQGIKLGQMVTREGTSLNLGSFSHLINHNPSAVYSVLGNVITTKASAYEPGAKYNKEIATPPATITAHTNEIITISIEDANGNSQATVAGTTNSLVDVWKITNATPVADFATGTKIASDIGNGAFRWIGLDGFKLVFNNKDNGVYRYCSMSKGDYTVGWYLYDVPTGGLTQEQSTVLNAINVKNAEIFTDVNSITAGFVEATDSLHAIRAAVDAVPTNVLAAAATTPIAANIKYVNDVEVTGTGTDEDTWGPAA